MKNIKRIFLIFVILIIPILVITSGTSLFQRLIPDTDEFSASIDDGWKYRWENDKYSGNLTLPCVVEGGKPDRILWISNILHEESFHSTTLFIRTSQQYLKVYIDGELTYNYGPETGKESYLLPGSSWHFVKLPKAYAGKKVEISLVSPYKQYSGNVNRIFIGSESSVILDTIYNYSTVFIISCIILLIGFILIILHFFFKSDEGRFKSLLYLGHFSILSGMWIISESKIIQFLVNSPVFIYYVACIALFLLPIPLLLFIITTYKPKKSNLLSALVWVFRIFFIMASVSQVIYNGTFMNIMPFFHVLLLICILAIIYISIIEMKNNNNSIRLFFMGCIILCIFSIIDMFDFYFSSIPGLNAQGYLQFAILLFIIMLLASLGQYILEIFNDQTRNKAYRELAYTDSLTGLKNRTSYEEKISQINDGLQTKSEIFVIIFDLNNLKRVNDTFGHQEGDHLINITSRLISECFDKIGEVYRIGGDEFAVVVTEFKESNVVEKLSLFNSRIDEYNNGDNQVKIGIAYGMASFENGKDKSLHSVIVRADEEMYKCKKMQKQT